jgi:Putative transposase
VLQIGRLPGAPWVTSTGTRQAHLDGFDLHANVHVAADNRDGLEQLARYVLRLPIAQERLTRTADGRVLLTLKTEWTDGTTALLFEPVELLERLAALTPRPRRSAGGVGYRGGNSQSPRHAGVPRSGEEVEMIARVTASIGGLAVLLADPSISERTRGVRDGGARLKQRSPSQPALTCKD